MNVKRKLLISAIKALHLLGLDKLYIQNGAVILMYHSISDGTDISYIDPSNDMNKSIFEFQMKYLKRYCNVISLTELNNLMTKGKEIPCRTVAITFDDGYKNNFTNAVPILNKYDLPATIFLATKYIDQEIPQWIDELYNIYKYRTKHLFMHPNGNEASITITNNNQHQVYRQLTASFLTTSFEQRMDWIEQLRKQLLPNVTMPILTMSWDDVRCIRDNYQNISIGSHTDDHVDISKLNANEINKQVSLSVNRIEKQTGLKPKLFTYPYGRSSKRAVKEVASLGLEFALVTEPLKLTTHNSNKLEITRVESPESKILFKHYVSGSYPALAQKLFSRY